MVRRAGQPARHAHHGPAAKDRGQGGRLDRRLPLALRQNHRNGPCGLLRGRPDGLRHPGRKFRHAPLRHPALHLPRERPLAHPDRPGAPRGRHFGAAVRRGDRRPHDRRMDEVHPGHGRLGQRRGTRRLHDLLLCAVERTDAAARLLERRHPRHLGTQEGRGGEHPLPATRRPGPGRHRRTADRGQAHRFLHRIPDPRRAAGRVQGGHLVRGHGGSAQKLRGGDRLENLRRGGRRGLCAVEPRTEPHPHRGRHGRGEADLLRRSTTR